MSSEPPATDLLALDEALAKLEARDKRKADVVMLRYFAGLSIEETAAALDVSPATVKNEWTFARAWLHREMEQDGGEGDESKGVTVDRWKLVEDVFLEVSAADASKRDEVLRAKCGDDAELIAEIRSLLSHHGQSDSKFLDAAELQAMSVGLGLGGGAAREEPAMPSGTRFGGFTIKGILGTGGMGIVYVAEQERPRRTVALKVIRRGLGTASLLRRFEHEAEMLGRLQHPGIAQIFQAGSADLGGGPQPYIAMELVHGPTLTEFAEKRQLSSRQKLELMVRVCDAVNHAHQRGIIHRDLKPANILVDESGQPKVLDFGVARATDADLHVTTLQTSVGQLIGTLPYMSPEQVLADPGEVDTRSDVYALGVILYQLLTGKLPHDLKSRSIPEAARVIRDEAPARLSAVSKIFRGEVEIIVGKALEKNKARRYQSAADLGADIQRYLAGQPIAAKDDSALYVLRKQLKRYQGVVVAASLFVIGLSLISVYAWVQAERNRELAVRESAAKQDAVIAQNNAESERRRANEKANLLDAQLIASNIQRGRLEGLAGNVAIAEDLVWREFLKDPSSVKAKWALWELYDGNPCLWTRQISPKVLRTLAFSPDGRMLAVAADDGVTTVLRTSTGETIATIPTHKGFISGLAFVDEGSTLLSFGIDGQMKLWDIATRAVVRTFAPSRDEPAHRGGVIAAQVLSDGKTIVSCGREGLIRAWNLQDGTLVREKATGVDGAVALACSLTAQRAAIGTRDGKVAVFEYSTLEPAGTLPPEPGPVYAVTFSADGARLAYAGRERIIRVCDARSLDPVCRFDPELESIRSLSFSPDGKSLLSAGAIAVYTWDIEGKKLLSTLGGHRDRIMAGAWSPDGHAVATLCVDGAVKLWGTQQSPSRRSFEGHSSWVFGLAFSQTRPIIVSGSGDRTLRVWDRDSGAQIAQMAIGVPRCRAVRFRPGEDELAAACEDGRIYIFDGHTWAPRRTFASLKSEIYQMYYTPDGRYIITAGVERVIRILDADSGMVIGDLGPFSQAVTDFVVSRDGSTLYAPGNGSRITAWNLENRSLLFDLTCAGDAWGLDLDKDERLLAIGTNEGHVEIWDVPTRSRLALTMGHSQLAAGVAFSPDGSLLATGGDDGALKLWEVPSLTLLVSIPVRRGEVPNVTFDPARPVMGATFRDKYLATWDLTQSDVNIAGNLEYQIARLKAELKPEIDLGALREWAAKRISEQKSRVDDPRGPAQPK
jgi:WD40 repeat protein